MLRRAALTGAGAIGAASVGTAFVYRPKPWTNPPRDPLSERADEEEGLLMKASRVLTFIGGTASFSLLMHVLNSFELKDDDHYRKFLDSVTSRPEGVPLLTVTNHTSPLDDPGVLIGMLPASVTIRPKFMRWSICAQEICFKWTLAQTGFGLAKVMPIARGDGIDQRLLLNFYRRLLTGGWCHIFPGGHCDQDGTLGGRAPGPNRDKHGGLKWGVGKMIAHAPVPPTVIPLYHTGMANLVPLNPFTRKILHVVPRFGHKVTARAGAEIRFDDLLEEHVRLHGSLRKLALSGGEGDSSSRGVLARGAEGDILWRSTREERLLYSRITSRVEEALLVLEAEAKRDLGEDFPELPEEPAAMLRASRGEEISGRGC